MRLRLPRRGDIWLPGYLKSRWRGMTAGPPPSGPARVWLTIADHFEPYWNHAGEAEAAERVALWRKRWPEIAAQFRDAAGRPPCYSFFYPEEEYRPELIEPLRQMVDLQIADVEVHLHHDGEGRQNFVDRMSGFIEALSSRHSLLRKQNGRIVFGFIHGNWALDNSREDGRYCGMNDEITVLRDLGCYADFTMPSAPSDTQSRIVNAIWWATDDPTRPKSYDRGVPAEPGSGVRGDLLMIPGPLGIRWGERLLPRLETGAIAGYDLPTPYRVRRWIQLAPRLGIDIFVKLHTHGTQERNSTALLNGGLAALFELMQAECRRRGMLLYFASAWGMRNEIERRLVAPEAAQLRTGTEEAPETCTRSHFSGHS